MKRPTAAPTQSPSYAVDPHPSPSGSGSAGGGGGGAAGGAASLPLAMDPVLAVVTNSVGHQVSRVE